MAKRKLKKKIRKKLRKIKIKKKLMKKLKLKKKLKPKKIKPKKLKKVIRKIVKPVEKEKPKVEEIKFKIENIVASANLNVELDLYGIAREVDNVEYEPEQFPGAILKLRDPKTSLLLFKNGKLICTGAKSEEEVEKAIHKAYSLIKECIKG